MRNSVTRCSIAAAVSLALGGAAYAAAEQGQVRFESADLNSDGAISYSEAQQTLKIDQNLFNQVDQDRDQLLSRTEFDQAISLQTQAQPQASGMQQPTQAPTEGAGATVQVKEQPAQVQVRQPEPQITVEQQAPRIEVQQPPPQVQVETPKPRVEVQQAEPQVTVIEQGKPQVEIEKAGEPQVITGQEQPQGSTVQQQAQQGQQLEAAQPAGGRLEAMRASELRGMEVVNHDGKEIGEVEQIVLDPQGNTLHAVVSVGGVLGIGEKRVTLALDELELRDDQLVAATSMSEDDLKDRQAYLPSNYREVGDDRTLAEAVSGGGGSSGSGTFATLDQNGDGHISKDEAAYSQRLTDEWPQADSNNDQRIDQAEFSAFEQAGGQ